MVIRDGKVLLRDTLEEEISFGEITDEHILFICANDTGYKRTIYTVSPENGVQIGALYIDDYYPYGAGMTNEKENEFFVLYGLGMNSNRISTIIRLYGSNLETSPVASIELEGLYPVLLQSGQKILFAGENKAFCYDQALDSQWSKEFETELQAAGLFENGGAVFALADRLIFCDSEGKEIRNIPVNGGINGIEVYKNTAAVISGTKAVFYTSTGNSPDSASLAGMNLKVNFVDEKKVFLI
jgi:hypothetical protein